MAFTIEPRLSGNGLPSIGFHIVVVFEGGQKTVVSELDPLFEFFGMKDLIDTALRGRPRPQAGKAR